MTTDDTPTGDMTTGDTVLTGDMILTGDVEKASSSGASKGRTAGAIVLGVLGVVLLMVSTIAVWARATVFDSDKVGTIVDDALSQPEVQAGLATYLTDQVVAAVDVDAVVKKLLVAPLDRFAPAVAAGATQAIERGITKLLSNQDVEQIIGDLVERAHSRLMQILEGEKLSGAVTVVDGAVTLNLLPLISRGLAAVQERGLFDDLVVPDFTADGDPSDQIAQLETAVGRDLPDDFGQLVVYQSDRLDQRQQSLQAARDTFELVKQALWIIFVLAILTIAGCVLLANDRWAATLYLGLGIAVSMAFLRSFGRFVINDAPGLAATPAGSAAIDSIVSDALTGLLRLGGLVLFLALAAVVFALFRRGWQRTDLSIVGGVVAFVAIVALFGLSLGSLLVGLIVGGLIPFVSLRRANGGHGDVGAPALTSEVS